LVVDEGADDNGAVDAGAVDDVAAGVVLVVVDDDAVDDSFEFPHAARPMAMAAPRATAARRRISGCWCTMNSRDRGTTRA
jgi:hypothetical protein